RLQRPQPDQGGPGIGVAVEGAQAGEGVVAAEGRVGGGAEVFDDLVDVVLQLAEPGTQAGEDGALGAGGRSAGGGLVGRSGRGGGGGALGGRREPGGRPGGPLRSRGGGRGGRAWSSAATWGPQWDRRPGVAQ